MSGLDTYFLEVSAHSLVKAATKIFFRGKKLENLAFLDYFSEVKRRSMTKVNHVFFTILEHSFLVQIDTFCKFCT